MTSFISAVRVVRPRWAAAVAVVVGIAGAGCTTLLGDFDTSDAGVPLHDADPDSPIPDAGADVVDAQPDPGRCDPKKLSEPRSSRLV